MINNFVNYIRHQLTFISAGLPSAFTKMAVIYNCKLIKWIRETIGQLSRIQNFAQSFFKQSLPSPINSPSPKDSSLRDSSLSVATPVGQSKKTNFKQAFWNSMLMHPPFYNHLNEGPDPIKSKKDYMSRQVEGLLDFFNTELNRDPQSLPDLTYVTVGFGECIDQIYPGFIFEFVDRGLNTHILAFECPGSGYRNCDLCLTHICQQYEVFMKKKGIKLDSEKFKNMNLTQFTTGFPCRYVKVGEPQKHSGTLYWPSHEKLDLAKHQIQQYLEKMLTHGKKVVLGWHCDRSLREIGPLFTQLATRYPGQISLCIGHEGVNLITDKPLDLLKDYEEIHHDDLSKFIQENPEWRHFPGNLGECLLPKEQS